MLSRRTYLKAVPLGLAASTLTTRPAAADTGAIPAAASAVRAFTADLYRTLAATTAATTTTGNLVCAPYSVAVALAMARVGAAGSTGDEMDAVLHAPEPRPDALHPALGALDRLLAAYDDPGGTGAVTPRMSTANALWPQVDLALRPQFVDTLSTCYAAAPHPVDFLHAPEPARQEINAWVSQRTAGRIPQLLSDGSISAATSLVLTNAISLKAAWLFPFPKAATTQGAFTTAAGTTVSTPMMAVPGRMLGYRDGGTWHAVRLPYVGGTLAMTVVVPRSGQLADLEATIDETWLRSLLTGFSTRTVQVRLPRWNLRQPTDLTGGLTGLGLRTAFTIQADFTAMCPVLGTHLDRVAHEAFIAVDEDGTEAAGASAVVVVPPQLPTPVIADRPFLYVIHDIATATPLFIGRVGDPTSGT